jgi:hypothetical protein
MGRPAIAVCTATVEVISKKQRWNIRFSADIWAQQLTRTRLSLKDSRWLNEA